MGQKSAPPAFQANLFFAPCATKSRPIRSEPETVRTGPHHGGLQSYGLINIMLSAIAAAISLCLVSLTALPLIKSGRWWIRVWDFPRQQLGVLLAGALVVQLALWPDNAIEQIICVATMFALAWHLWWIFPYTRLRKTQVKPASRGADPNQRIRLLVANVYQFNRNIHGLFRNISIFSPDLVLVLEADDWWDRHLAALRHRYPQVVARPQQNTYGMLLFSRLELMSFEVRELVTKGVPSIKALVKLRSGKIVELHCLHPEPPFIGSDAYERDAELLLVAKETTRSPHPAIVCGDMNDVAWSRTSRLFQRMSGLLDPRIGRGLYSTFDAKRWYARWPLDHIFHDRRFLLNQIQVGGRIGSDHFPIFVELIYQPDATEAEETPETADSEDYREAAQKIQSGKEAAREAEQEPATANVATVARLG